MSSAYRKIFPIKITATDSISFSLAHKNHLGHEPTILRSCGVQFLVNLCSLVEADSKTGRKSCESENKLENQKSCTVSFLINSCGLSREMAVSASEKVRFENLDKPKFVLEMFRKYGFCQKQIASIVRRRPGMLLSNEETLLPKLEFFDSFGSPRTNLAALSADPALLNRSLEHRLIPIYNFLKSVLLTDERVAVAMKQSSRVFKQHPNKNMAPNVAFLRELEVPDSCIMLLLTHYPETIVEQTDDFKESVEKVLEMGFDPLRSMFMLALHVVAEKGNRRIWDRCYKTYSSWGWSKDDIYSAFRKHPNCMIMSQNKISRIMDFLVNKMGWESRKLSSFPEILLYSLENRIIPRCTVIKVLLSRGLIAKEVKPSYFLKLTETHFLAKFVTKYEKEVPEFYDVYEGKIGLPEITIPEKSN
ncbi:transcription termination factor MTERF8, chloroplastic-like [Primulina eburnea]|uniref:transcription termination factor MTERF8, chloroplastic-like n=1 Tax=Primulina eburnea TaxID=1245227 RepID=UPI003C6C1112